MTYNFIRLLDPMGTQHQVKRLPRKLKKASKMYFKRQRKSKHFKGLVWPIGCQLIIGLKSA